MEEERKAVLKLLNSSHFRTLVADKFEDVEKDSERSETLRQAGNDLFKLPTHNSLIHKGIWLFYSSSISRAESNTEGLAKSYSNRSVILMHLSKYEESVRDIDRAFGITKNVTLKIKLLLRKAKCLHMIGSKFDHNALMKEVFMLLDKIREERLKKSFQAEIGKVATLLLKPIKENTSLENGKAEALNDLNKKHKLNDFSLVEMQFNEKYGRHLVAATDIKPGEVIYIEKPYVQFVNTGSKNAYCSHCFATVWDNIPCDYCNWAMFCSEKCKKEAWEKYHDIECFVYSEFQMDNDDSYRQLALRIISQALKEYGSVECLKEELSTWGRGTDYNNGFVDNGKLQAMGLKSVYNLSKNVPASSLNIHIGKTASMLKSLGKNTSFFGKGFDFTKVESYKNNENVIFLGSLFLRLSKISQLNDLQMWNRTIPCIHTNSDCLLNECCTAGAFIAPITGMLNHDCFPNAGRCYTSEHTVLLYAIEPIQKGSQIFTSYLQTFRNDKLAHRRATLSNRYNFNCSCFSCQKKLEIELKQNSEFPSITNVLQKPGDAIDLELHEDSRKLLNITNETNFKTLEESISYLRKGLEKAFAPSRSEKLPSIGSSFFTVTLQIVFDKIYGIQLNIPNDCNRI